MGCAQWPCFVQQCSRYTSQFLPQWPHSFSVRCCPSFCVFPPCLVHSACQHFANTCWGHLVHMLLNTQAVPHGPLSGCQAANAATKTSNKHGMSHAERCNLCTSGQAWYTPTCWLPPPSSPAAAYYQHHCWQAHTALVFSAAPALPCAALAPFLMALCCGGGTCARPTPSSAAAVALAHVPRPVQLRRGRLRVLRLRGASSSVASESAAVWVSSLTVASSSSSPSSPAMPGQGWVASSGVGGRRRGG